LEHLSADAPSALLAAFSLSDPADLRRLLARAGFPEPTLSVREIMLELPALEVFLPLHLASTPVAQLFEEAPVADQARVVASAREVLSSFGTGTTARTPFRSWFAIARV
jgi:hypothetical protein